MPRPTPPPAKPNPVVGILFAALLVGALGWFGFTVARQASGPHEVSSATPPPQMQPGLEPGAILRNEKATFARYAGSSSCRECHQAAYEAWLKSNHGLAERPASALDDPAFTPSRAFAHGTQQTELRMTGTVREVVTLGPSGKVEPFVAERVIGQSPLRQFLTPFPGGRWQVFEASYDPRRQDWFNVYGTEDRQPGEWGHWTGRGMNWNNMCAACHNTRVRKNYDESTDSYHTTMAEPTVSCEACHGPLQAHVSWRRKYPDRKWADPTIKKLGTEAMFETCAQCHSRRADLTGDFEPGESFFDHHELTVVDESTVYYPDGQVHDEDYEYAAFLGSKMHAAGVRCMNCHEPHTAKLRLPGNLMCMSCHTGDVQNAPVIDPASHSFHKIDPLYTGTDANVVASLAGRDPETVAKSGGECINCHMPQTFYMQRHRRHDHGFTIPDPLLTQEHGIPNACNRCHTDHDAGWAREWTDKWYGAKMQRPTRTRAELFAIARVGQTQGRDGLLTLVSGREAPYWKASAINLLERWAAEPAVQGAITAALKDPSPLVRANAAQVLGNQAADPSIRTALEPLLTDPVRNVRYAAEWSLRGTLDPASVPGHELQQILDLQSDQPQGQMQKGAYAVARNDAAGAKEHYAKAVEWDAHSAPIRHDYAVVLSQVNEPQAAVAQLEEACRLEPENAEYRYSLALAYNEVGKPDQTIRSLEETVRLNPAFTRAWYNLGLALSGAGRNDEAIRALDVAAQADPQDPGAYYAKATIFARLRRIDEAREAAARALQIQPDYAPALQLLQHLR